MSLGQSEDELLSLGSPTIDEGGSSGGNSGTGTGTVMLKKGPWTCSEDAILVEYVKKHGEGNWNAVQKYSGLSRCGKSCRLRWANHLRPNLKKGGFTPEEEHLIIELHAKMGNKWARMAAHMPGRTDNEIKNYWNTRIKRHQRAGLPLYPPELCVEEYQAYQNDEDKGHNNPLQASNYDISNVLYTNLRNNQGFIPYMPPLPEFSSGNSLMTPLLYSFINPRKRTLSDYDGGTQFETNRDPPNQDSQSLINGNNFSESKPPIIGAMNMELPSFQYQETNFSTCFTNPSLPALESVDTFIQSGPTPLTNCPSPRSSGLLEALVFSSSKNPSSEKSLNSSSTDLIEYEGYGNSNSPFGNNVKSEAIDYSWNVEEEKNELNPMRPDVLLGSCWSGGPTNMSYAAAIFGEHMGGETSNTLDFDSCLVDEHTCM